MVEWRCDVEGWLSATELSKILEIPETTTRRYLTNFEEYFRSQKIGRGKKYHPDSTEVLRRIANLYDTDRETKEIKVILANEFAFTVEDVEHETTIRPPPYDISSKFDEFQQKQEEFNKKMLQQFYEQQRHIKELVENKSNNLDELKRLNSPEAKRAERFDRIMLERKVSRLLEEEALDLWDAKPKEERTLKIGWFRKIEDRDKRDRYIKEYIHKRFEEYLKKELGIE